MTMLKRLLLPLLPLALIACTPTVQVAAPKEPICPSFG